MDVRNTAIPFVGVLLVALGCESTPPKTEVARTPSTASRQEDSPARPKPPAASDGPDSDGDGVPDASDRYPLVADFNLLTWEIHALQFGWSIATDVRSQRQTTLTWTTGESEVEVEGDKNVVRVDADVESEIQGKGSLNTNPLRLFGLLDMSVSIAARAKAGLSYSKEMEWGVRRQRETRRAAESFEKISSETRMSDPFLSIWVTFRNHSADDLVLQPKGLPVFAAGEPLVSASAVERDGPDGSLLLPANRPEGVEVQFKAPLDTTTARRLLAGLGTGAPSIDLARSRSVVRRVDGSGDAISAARKIEDQTVEISVSSGDVRGAWRIAASDARSGRPVTIGAALSAINDRLMREFGDGRGKLFAVDRSRLRAVAATPFRSDEGLWLASVGGRDVGKLEEWSLDQPLKMGHPVVIEFKMKAELQHRQYGRAAEHADAQAQVDATASEYSGEGVPNDKAKAIERTRRAADQGNANAQRDLGVMYETGTGVGRDFVKAAEWYRKAAAQGDAKAQLYLGAMYLNYKLVPRDFVQAYAWLQLAAAGGIDVRPALFDTMRTQMSSAQVEAAEKMVREFKPKTQPTE